MTTATKDAQMAMGEQVISNDALLEMLHVWEDNKEGAALYKKALADIKANVPNEPGRYRYGPCVCIVSQKKTVKIEAVD